MAAIAGCNETSEQSDDGTENSDDGTGDSDDGTEDSDENGESEDEEELTLETFDYPDGVDESGFADYFPGVQDEYLSAAGSATVTREQRIDHARGSRSNAVSAVIEGDRRLLSVDREWRSVAIWDDGSGSDVLVRMSDGRDERYMIGELDRYIPDNSDGIDALEAIVPAGNFEATEVVADGDEPVAVFESDELVNESAFEDTEIPEFRHMGSFESFEASVSVTEAGVDRYECEVDGQIGDRPIGVSETVTFEDVGETVLEEPDWLESGSDRAVDMTLDMTDDGTAVVARLERGESIPAGSIVTLDTNEYLEGELDRELSPGQTLYLYKSDGELGTAIDERPDAESTFDDEHWFIGIRLRSGVTVYDGSYSAYESH